MIDYQITENLQWKFSDKHFRDRNTDQLKACKTKIIFPIHDNRKERG